MLAETKGPYEARVVKGGMPTGCCDYGVVSLSEGREVCRVWSEQDARAIAAALSAPPVGSLANLADATPNQPPTEAREDAVKQEAIPEHEGWRYGEMIYRAMYENIGGRWGCVSANDRDAVWYPAGYRLASRIRSALTVPSSTAQIGNA